ncbi:hypothetical protein K2173_023717 [Erythroxylum novogranatense]|uniref:Ribosomal protein L33 n=1 Tax=Erythroxylum novogranatense TaxID=1862640 RepID=A0AAV8TSP6_9ROSI|nr:hypothetical protein K2173_023717 [Erythroxylum novogranatense]
MVATKKTKKTHESINSRLTLVMKSDKYTLGYKTVLKNIRITTLFVIRVLKIEDCCPPFINFKYFRKSGIPWNDTDKPKFIP